MLIPAIHSCRLIDSKLGHHCRSDVFVRQAALLLHPSSKFASPDDAYENNFTFCPFSAMIVRLNQNFHNNMSAIFQRLEQRGLIIPQPIAKESNRWIFQDQLLDIDQESGIWAPNLNFYRYLARHHLVLNLEYSVQCAELIHTFKQQGLSKNFQKKIQSALMMAELLEIIYRDYLNVPREIIRLRREQAIYRKLLKENCLFPQPIETDSCYAIGQAVRQNMATLNWPRLFTLRVRRIVLAISPLTAKNSLYRLWISSIDRGINPILTHVAWVFFLPRLAFNLCMIAKHLIPGSWMTTKEHQLGWQIRFMAEWDRRWFEIGNDAAWMTCGLLNCFVMTPAHPFAATYLGLGVQLFDVCMASIRYFTEINRLSNLHAQYETLKQDLQSKACDQDTICVHQTHLQERINFEKNRLLLSIINASVLFVGMNIALLPMTFAPLIGAALLMLMTLSNYFIGQEIEKQRPVSSVIALEKPEANLPSRHSFFYPSHQNKLNAPIQTSSAQRSSSPG